MLQTAFAMLLYVFTIATTLLLAAGLPVVLASLGIEHYQRGNKGRQIVIALLVAAGFAAGSRPAGC